MRLLRAAADKDNNEAMYRLGVMLVDGKVVAKDAAEAMRLFTKASRGRLRAVDAGPGLAVQHGDGGRPTRSRRRLWYKRAADLGSSAGMVNLGFMHQLGKGVEQERHHRGGPLQKGSGRGQPIGHPQPRGHARQRQGRCEQGPGAGRRLILQALEMRNEFSFRQMTQNSRAWSPEFRRDAAEEAARRGGLLGQASTARCAIPPSPPSTPTRTQALSAVAEPRKLACAPPGDSA